MHVVKNATGLYCSEIMAEYVKKLIDRKHPLERISRFIQYLSGTFELGRQLSLRQHPIRPGSG